MITKYQKFEAITIKREQINFAYYNPRKISDSNRKKLRDKLKKMGLLNSLVWNKNTGNLVSGHQRLSIIDQLEKTEDYEITVDCVNLSEKEEIEANVFFNNQSAMGEWNVDMLQEIQSSFNGEIDFITDFGFDKIDLDFMGLNVYKTEPFIKTPEEKNQEIEKMRDLKKQYREQQKQEKSENGDSVYGEQNDYYLTIVFNNNRDKWNFLNKIRKDVKEKYIKASIIYDVVKEEYRF